MNTPLHHDPQQPDVFLGSTQTPPSRLPLTSKDSKRVCFYKSGDPQFSGHWVVINSRTFKTFEALLDALSNKVPLPFGVRTITTPKGTHTIQSLDGLQHGASYVCSDQRKVKPLNLDEINRRHVPWNSPRPASAGRQGRRGLIRQLVKKNEVGRMVKRAESSVTVRTPKRLMIFKNRDPSTKRIVVLQRRTAPTFEALLEYLSQVMQFPVVKLFTADGRRVEGLPGLILCSGVIIAAGNEPFQMPNFSLQESTQPSHSAASASTGPNKMQPLQQVLQKSVSSSPRSRNFSLSSERYFVNQINMSLNGNHLEENKVKAGSTVSTSNRALESEEIEKCDFTPGTEEKVNLIIPSDDEIEKSFRVNQDGSMTVEMKVRLTIKQEETIHWTTTVSRASVNSQEMAPFSQTVSSYNTPDNKDNNKRESSIHGYESKHESTQMYKPVRFNAGEHHSESATSEAMENPKPRFRRLPTPGPRRIRRKETSLENIKRLSQTEVQESTVGAYSYVQHTTESELFEGYCVVSHSSSSSTRPIPKPRKKNLEDAKYNMTHCSHSGMAEVLQLHNKGKEITETVMHIYQSQDTCENYLAKTWAHEDYQFECMCEEHKKLDSTEPGSSSNDCNTDLTKLSTSSGSGNANNNACLSLLSGQSELSATMSINASSFTDNEIRASCESSEKEVKRSTNRVVSKKAKMGYKSERSNKHLFLKSIVTDKKQNGSAEDLKNHNSPESQSFTGSDKNRQKVKQTKKGQSAEKIKACHNDMLKDTSQNINLDHTDVMDKLGIIPSFHSAPFMTLTKQRSVNGIVTKSPKVSKELSESISMPVLHSSPCNVHQYVENWLENIQTESVPYMDELNLPQSRARFQINSDFSDISETRSELDKDNLEANCASAEGPTVRKSVPQLIETQNMIRSCKSMPSTRIDAAEKAIGTRKNKSSEDLVSKLPGGEGETSPNTQLKPRSGMKDIMEQLCLSVQFIRRSCSHSHLSSVNNKKKSNSLPDFSSHLASVFGSPYKALLSFLTVMTLKDGITSSVNDDSGGNPEALQVMQSIQTLVSIEDEEELKASLASLHSSTSARLKKSWRDFREKNNIKESPPLSPRQSEQEFTLEVNSEEDDQDKGHVFGIREVMDELNMCEDLRREISSLVRGDMTNYGRAKHAENHCGHENKTIGIACENEDAAMKNELGVVLVKERRYLEKAESQYEDITNTKPVDLIPFEDITNQKGPAAYTPEIVEEDVRTNQEKYACNEPSKADLCEEKQEMMDSVQITEEKYTENEISQVDEFQMPNYSPTNLEDKVERQDIIGSVKSESELCSLTLEMEPNDARSNSEVIENTASKTADCTDSLEGRGMNSNKEDTYSKVREHPKQDIKSVDSETESEEEHRLNNCTFQTEENNAMYKDARSEASSFINDEAVQHSNNENGSKKIVNNNNSKNTLCNTSECENQAKPHHSSMSNEDDGLSDHNKSVSCTWQESETEPELQKLEGSATDKHAHEANESDEEADEEDFDANQNSHRQLCQEDGYSDNSQTFEEESVFPTHSIEEEDDDRDEHDDKKSNAFDTDKDLDTQSHCSEDPSVKDILSRELCKSEEKHKAQSEDSAAIDGKVDHECHCLHPTVFPQQLLDFLNLALKSSALIFTYDSNGRLRIEPNRCESRARSLYKSNVDNQYARRCLPSPNTSDLSDYRPDTSDSEGVLSQVSTDLLTEIAEDEAERLFLYQGSENLDRKVKTLDNGSKKPHPDTKPIASPNSKSINSFNSFADSIVNGTIHDPVYFNSSDSIGNSELGQCPVFHAKPDSGEGKLIDKGRWLLKENHLIRKSPPVPMGMYENMDTTSVDTGQENISEDTPYIPCGRKQSVLAGISSSELEDMAKPPTPKCTYFNMAHSSDSDPFRDNQSITSNKGKGFTRKSNEVSPLEPSKMLAKKNGSLPSFKSVDLKMAAGKVHPGDSMVSSVVEKSAQSLRCNTPHEEDSAEGLSLRCGQHCPIL